MHVMCEAVANQQGGITLLRGTIRGISEQHQQQKT